MIRVLAARLLPLSDVLAACRCVLSPDDLSRLVDSIGCAYTWGDNAHSLVACDQFAAHVSCFEAMPSALVSELDALLQTADFVDLAM